MRTSMLFLAGAASLLGAQTAFAQETGKSPAQSFAGPRAEVTVGLDQSSDDVTIGGSEVTGLRVGGAIGYDVAIGKRVTLGVEAGIGWMAAGHTKVGPFPPDTNIFKISGAHDADVSARIGYAVSPKTLIYAKAGLADGTYRTSWGNGQSYTPHDDEGLRVGGGIEQKLTRNVYAKAEYRYTMYGDRPGDNDTSRHQLLTGVGVRF